MKRLFQSLSGISLLALAVQAQALMLTVENGELVSVWGVEVNGQLHDVTFRDGTCIEVFSGCDEGSDFFFQNPADALLAAQALQTQVFIDGPTISLDSQPDTLLGCPPFSSVCAILIAFEPGFSPINGLSTFSSVAFENSSTNVVDFVHIEANRERKSSSEGTIDVFSIWSLSSAPIPAPPTALLASLGLVPVIGAAWRRKRHAVRV